MIDKFWESLGGEVAGEWLRRAFSPPFLLYLSGLAFYLLEHDWRLLWGQLMGLALVEQIALLLLLLVVLILSSLLTARWRFTLLRWMEGYWPWPLRWLEAPFSAWQARRLSEREHRLNILLNRPEPIDIKLARRRAELEIFTHYYPAEPEEIRPTRLGNILRAGETASQGKYGLDAYVCWPRLWPLLPENLRGDLNAVRTRLLTLAEIFGMGMLSLVWGIWSPWALIVAFFWMWAVYQMALPVAMSYADLIESAFDLYRFSLYDAVGWARPTNSEIEPLVGEKLTEFLWRGVLPAPVTFVTPQKD